MTAQDSRTGARGPAGSGPLFLVIIAVVAAAGLAAYVYELRQPNLGFALTPDALVVAVDPGGPAAQAGMREGDELLLLNGVSPHDVDAYGAMRGAIASGQAVPVQVLREWEAGEVSLTLTARSRSVLLEGHVVSYLAAALFLALGALVYSVVWGAPLGWVYFLLMAACATLLACTVPMGSRGLSALQRLSIGLLPGLFVHYTMLFPDERPLGRWRRLLLALVYLVSLFAALSNAALLLWGQEQAFLWTYNLIMGNVIGGFLVGLGVLVWTDQAGASETRATVREMAAGVVLAAIPFILLLGLDLATGFRAVDTRVLVLSAQGMPFAMGYAVLKGRWSPLDSFVRRLLILALTLLVGFLVYAVVVWGLVLAFGIAASGEALAAGFAAAIVMGLVVVPLADRVRRLVDRWFFRR